MPTVTDFGAKMMEPTLPVVMNMGEDLKTTEMNAQNAKITMAILEWYESWQIWQKKILITGIVNRFELNQLKGLLMAVESVFHKDFATSVKKIFPVNKSEIKIPDKICKAENNFVMKKTDKERPKDVPKMPITTMDEIKTDEAVNLNNLTIDMTRLTSPRLSPHGPRIRTTSGSETIVETCHPLSPIAEGDAGLTEPIAEEQAEVIESLSNVAIEGGQDFAGVANTAVLISHLLSGAHSPNTSQVSTLVSSLSPIEETSPESTESGGSDAQFPFPPLQKSDEEQIGDKKVVVKKKESTKKKEVKKRKKKKRKKQEKVLPETVVKRIASYSMLVNRPVPSVVSLTPLGMESSLSLDFRSRVTSANVQPDDFFEPTANEVLGRPVTTLSKIGKNLKDEYDFTRNHAPIPTMQQLYKSEKFWKKDTVKSTVSRLKEQFREQLEQIWEWIDNWPSYRRSRLLLQLFDKSSEKLIHFAAECVKAKKEEAASLPPPIMRLSDSLLVKIFGYLTPIDLLEASLVCRRWYMMLNNDEMWKEKCDKLGKVYGISDLSDLLSGNAGENQTLDWKQAYIELHDYLTSNMEPVVEESSSSSEEEEESEPEKEEEEKFPDYIPYWKLHPLDQNQSRRKSSVKHVRQVRLQPDDTKTEAANEPPDSQGGFLQMWRNITEDIKEDLNPDDARSDACHDADMFADMQEWEDVGLLTNIGQRFAVDFPVKDVMDACAGNWPIHEHVLSVKKVQVYAAHTGSVNVVKFQANRIFTGSSDRCIRVWDKNGECFAKMTEALKGGVNDISIGGVDDPKVMYTASWDMSIRVWNSVTFRLMGTLTGHKGSVKKVAADNKFIVSCSDDGTIKVWDRKKLKCERTITCHNGAVECMIYHDRKIISGGVDKMIHLSNSFTGRLIRSFSGHKSTITALKKQHDLLASGDRNGNLFFWSLVNGDTEHLDKIKAHESQINAIYMHGPTFFTASKDALIKEWDLVTMTTVRIFQGHTDSITDIEWTDKFLLSASRDNDVRVWWWRKYGSQDPEEDVIKDKLMSK